MKKKWKHSGQMSELPGRMEKKHRELAERAAGEGIVLLKNENILPLDLSKPVALFGSGAEKTVKGGIGSGDVNNRENISIYRGLCETGAVITSEAWIEDYKKRYENAREIWKEKILEDAKHVENHFDAYASNPFVLPDGREILEEDLKGACAVIYVISRISGEGKDRRLKQGDYYLSEKEWNDILFLNERRLPIILMVNSGGPVELTGILEKAEYVKAVLNLSQPGQEAGYAVARILYGKTVPSGKLTTTWAKRYEDYPFSDSYSYLNGDLEKEEYREGIYVGYRYFDSFGIKPLFSFGYGLSYTTFSIEFERIEIEERSLKVWVDAKNTGNTYEGKEVIQVYVTLPYGNEVHEFRRLVGFAKTDLLKQGESQKLYIPIDQKQLAVYSEEKKAWLIEEGTYGIWTGSSSSDTQLQAFLCVKEEVIIEKTETICPKLAEFEDLKAPENLREMVMGWIEKGKRNGIVEYPFIPRKEVKKHSNNIPTATEYPVEEYIPLLYGNITKGASTLGSAGIRVPGSAGETSECLEEKQGIRSLIMADGPAGLRLRQCYQVDQETDNVYGTGVLGSLENGFLEPMVYYDDADTYYQFCTAFPVGTALAQTWNVKLMREFGRAVAEEMRTYNVDIWLAPGMNIHRNPLCGRNFEYFSEDPFLSGILAAAVAKGVQSMPGCAVTIKHFACNNQEDNRMGVDSCVSEKALREIYLRGFEIAVKQGSPDAIMTSYNLVNGVHAANSYDLCTILARKEWGFEGIIMSDWNTTVPEDGSISWKCAAAGNDIIMPGNLNDDKNIREALAEGKLTENIIRESAGRVIRLVNKLDKKEISYEGYELKWEEQFQGKQLNRNDWNVELHETGWVNNELQEYVDSPENIFLEDGRLVIKPMKKRKADGSVTYTSGRVNTQHKHGFLYGLFEAKIKVPEGKGFLPAFWMMPEEESFYGQWPRCGEIDIMEVLGDQSESTYGTIHYGIPHKESQGSYMLKKGKFSDDFHVFAVEWEPERIRWYVDGVMIFEEKEWYLLSENEGKKKYPAPFNQPFHVILNLAVGGNWPGEPDENTDFQKSALYVDYVKVYQKIR